MRKPAPSRKPRRITFAIALVILAVAAAAGALLFRGGGGPLGRLPSGLSPGDLNVVVVTLDTTRADRIGCYGAKDVATPRLDALAARGVVFERAISATPLTLPAHSSIFTAHLPGAHGVRDNGGFKLAPGNVTLAEVLKERGWKTGGFVAAYVLDRRWGIAQGFDTYFDDFDLSKSKTLSMGEIQRPGNEVVAKALSWMDTVKGDRFFAWVHLYDPHAPYEPPEPYKTRYAGHPYNGEIAWTDELVGRLLDGIDRAGVSGRTIVAVMGDHGESLGEHGESGHGYFVYEQTTRVPFVLSSPYAKTRGVRVPEVVRSVDVAPTLLAMLGLPDLLHGQGVSVVPLVAGTERSHPEGYSEAFYARFHYGWSELRAVRTKRWHFIEAPKAELYDVEQDPGETRNLAATEPDTVEKLRSVLAETEAATVPVGETGAPVEEDEETLRKLASLGYLGTPNTTDKRSWKDLPDPKDRVDVYNWMSEAREAIKEDRPEDAVAVLERVVARDPDVIDAWFSLGNLAYKKKEYARAGEYYRKTLDLKADHDYAMIGLADTLVAQGRVEDAVVGYERYLKQDPGNAQVTYRLAQVLLDAGRDAEAEGWFVKTLEAEPKTARAQVGLAVVAYRKKDLAASKAALERALAIDPKTRHARYNLALVREAQGDVAGAAEAYRAEIADHPDAYKAHFNLGRLLGKSGDREGAVASLRRAVEENPEFGVGRLFLGRALLEQGDLAGAAVEARAGLAKDASSPYAPLGHYVLADVYERQGRRADAANELRLGRAIEEKTRAARERSADRESP